MSANPRAQYTYDAFGRRVTKTHASTSSATLHSTGSATYTHHYLYDNQNIIAILNEDKELIASIVHHPSRTDTPLSITNHQTNKTYYYHRDHQGSIIALTNEYGEVIESIIYDGDFGEEFIHIRHETTFNPYGYTGREVDLDDLYYYRARYYDPTIKRFLSQDPIEFEAGDFNFYRYVGNDCVNFRDPSGFVSAEILWKNRTFLSHYWLGGGDTMVIAPDSDIGKEIKKHLKDFMNKKCKEILEEASDTCGLYTTTKHDKDIDFTKNKNLFSLGNSNVKTRALCVGGKCLLSFEIKDAFEDAKDINDETPDVMDEYPFATAYKIYYNSTMKCGY